MLTLDDKQPDLFDGWIAPHLLELSEEPAFVDKTLDDPRVLEPFLKGAALTGRPSIAIATYLRMMYLKHRYQISYALLVKEVGDSIKWRRFCHLPLSGKVPDDKTLIKLTGRYGEGPVRTIFETVVRRALEAKVIRGRKMRLDTTVMESNIHYPTDTGLLGDGVRVVSRTVRKIKEEVNLKTRFRNRTRAVKRRLIHLVKFLRGKKAGTKENLRRAKEEIWKIASAVWAEGRGVWEELHGKAGKTIVSTLSLERREGELGRWLGLLKKVMDQTRTVLDGNLHIPDRLVSVFDEGARPIQKGKLFPKTEFGRKVMIQEAEKGVVTGYEIVSGNPPDQTFLMGAIDRHEAVVGQAPRDLASDRGFYAPGQDGILHDRGIENVSIPVRGGKSGHRARTEKSGWFRGLQRWRAGGEAKISWLKRNFGLRRTAVRGNRSTASWLVWGLIAHNLLLLSRLGP